MMAERAEDEVSKELAARRDSRKNTHTQLQGRVRAEALTSRRGRGLIPPCLWETRDLRVTLAIANRGLRTGRSI